MQQDFESILRCEFTTKVIQTIEQNKMLNEKDKVIVGVSGGADSIALLFVLKALEDLYDLQIIGVHINHMLRAEEATRDEKFVQHMCKALNIPCHVEKMNIKATAANLKISEEEAGRKARYSVFKKYKLDYNANKIAVAHHMNDQAETIMFNMIRGSGLEGLGGIKPVRGDIVRPLMEINRQDIIDFCSRYDIEYVVDSSNSDNKYSRNEIRNELIPYLQEKFNPNLVNQIANMGKLLREESELLEAIASEHLTEMTYSKDENKVKLNRQQLLKCKKTIRKRMYRKVISDLIHSLNNIEAKHVELIDDMIIKETGKSINLPMNLVASTSYEYLILGVKEKTKSLKAYPVESLAETLHIHELNCSISFRILTYHQDLDIPRKRYTKWFDYDKMENGLLVRGRKTGDYIYLNGMTGKKMIKDYFIDNKIQLSKRDSIPLITNSNEVIWIIGYRINKNYMITEHTKKILEISVNKEDNDEI